MKIVVASILSRFDLTLSGPDTVRPVRRGLTAGSSPVRLVVKGRPQIKRDRSHPRDSLLQ
jgi:hypothetical protein